MANNSGATRSTNKDAPYHLPDLRTGRHQVAVPGDTGERRLFEAAGEFEVVEADLAGDVQDIDLVGNVPVSWVPTKAIRTADRSVSS